MSSIVLVCECGKRWNAPGAIPGRVGKCPSCGALLKVPEPSIVVPKPEEEYEFGPGLSAAPSYSATPHRAPATSRAKSTLKPVQEGLVKVPKDLESTLFESLAYPLWGSAGLSMLVFVTPALIMMSVPLITMLLVVAGGTAYAIPGFVLLIPASLGLLAVLGFFMMFLGRVLVSSSIGEILQPRLPGWDLEEIISELGRWFIAILAGGLIGGMPMVAYWIKCGEIDLFDRIVLLELAALAAAYAQMALLAAVLNESPWAANPITVLQAIGRVGWAWVKPCLVTGFAAMLVFSLLMASFTVQDPAASFFLYLLTCFLFIYESMVVVRILGLFHYRHGKAIGWHRRPKWR